MNYNKNKISWTDYTLNPIVGCLNNCPWCYARGQAKRQKHRCILCYQFIPHPHLERLNQITPRQKPKRIFIDSVYDFNGKGVKDEWLRPIIAKFRECPQHTFQILSKFPKKYERWEFPNNVWLGASVTMQRDLYRMHDLRAGARDNLIFVSFEPLLGEINLEGMPKIDWAIIGALSRPGKLPLQPEREWVVAILEYANKHEIPVYMKANLQWDNPRKEFPEVDPQPDLPKGSSLEKGIHRYFIQHDEGTAEGIAEFMDEGRRSRPSPNARTIARIMTKRPEHFKINRKIYVKSGKNGHNYKIGVWRKRV